MVKPQDQVIFNQDEHGAFINERGEEVQITEEMIQQACESLEKNDYNHHAQAANDSATIS